MCRIFFSPAGIHFEDLDLCRPSGKGETYQPLLCCIPCTSEHEGHDNHADSFVLARKYGDRGAKHSQYIPQQLTSSLAKRSSPLPSGTVTGQSPEAGIASGTKTGVGSSPGVKSNVRRDVSTPIIITPVGNGSPASAKLRPSKSRQGHRQITAESKSNGVDPQNTKQEDGKAERRSPTLQRSRAKKVRFSDMVERHSISSNSSDESFFESQSSCTDLPAAEKHSSAYYYPFRMAEDKKQRNRPSQQQPDPMSSKESDSDASTVSDCSEWLSPYQPSHDDADNTASLGKPIKVSWSSNDTETSMDYLEQGLEEGRSYEHEDQPTLDRRRRIFADMSRYDSLEPAYVVLS